MIWVESQAPHGQRGRTNSHKLSFDVLSMCPVPVVHKIKVKKCNKNIKWYSSYGVIVNFTDNARNVFKPWAWHSKKHSLWLLLSPEDSMCWGISGCSQPEVWISNWEDSPAGLAHLSQSIHITKRNKRHLNPGPPNSPHRWNLSSLRMV